MRELSTRCTPLIRASNVLLCTTFLLSVTAQHQHHHHHQHQHQHHYQQRAAATRAKLVKNLRNAAQGLATLQARQQGAEPSTGGAETGGKGGVGEAKGESAPALIRGNTIEAQAVCAALEQCLFHRIRVKEFGEDRVPKPTFVLIVMSISAGKSCHVVMILDSMILLFFYTMICKYCCISLSCTLLI